MAAWECSSIDLKIYIEDGDAAFEKTIKGWLQNIVGTDRGHALVLRIAQKGGTLKIRPPETLFEKKAHCFNTKASEIVFEPGYLKPGKITDPTVSITDPTVSTVLARKMEFIYLYHELVHIYRRRWDLFMGVGIMKTGSTAEEEFATTGLYEYSTPGLAQILTSGKNAIRGGYAFSENELRQDLGLPRRPYYYTDGESDKWKEERKRRMLLHLPDSAAKPSHRPEELKFKPNEFNRVVLYSELQEYLLGTLKEDGEVRSYTEEDKRDPEDTGWPVTWRRAPAPCPLIVCSVDGPLTDSTGRGGGVITQAPIELHRVARSVGGTGRKPGHHGKRH